MTVRLSIFVVLGAAVILVFVQTHPQKWRRWRVRLLALTGGAWLLSAGCLVVEAFGSAPLWKAIGSGDTNKLDQLLTHRPRLAGARTLLGDTALHLAVASGNTNTVALLLKAGVDVNVKGDSRLTPLHLAAVHGYAAVADMLLEAGADANAVGGRHNDTPLHVAAFRGHVGVVKVLLARGADTNVEDMLGMTPWQYAAEQLHTNVLAVLSGQLK